MNRNPVRRFAAALVVSLAVTVGVKEVHSDLTVL